MTQSTKQHGDNADPLTPPALTRTTPGRIVGGGQVILHTRQAHRLFYGRRSDNAAGIKPIIGLTRFADQVAHMHNAAVANDPFADWVLCLLDEQFEATNDQLHTRLAHFRGLLEGLDNLQFDLAQSTKPVTVPLRFYSPVAYQGVILLAKLDQLVRNALTARQVALMTSDDWEASVRQATRAVRNTYFVSMSWRSTGVTRDDMAANNQVAQRAIAVYQGTSLGMEIPEDILRGDRRSKHAPTIRTRDQMIAPDTSEDAPMTDGGAGVDAANSPETAGEAGGQ